MDRIRYTVTGILLAAVCLLSGSRTAPAQAVGAAAGGWRSELAEDLLVPWTRNARDTLHGAFRTHLDRRWRPTGPAEKYPSMLGRHLFSYSAGYLATGDRRWLALADSVYRYLARHGWDGRHGGWYDRLTRPGRPASRSKSTFVQVYAATGLALYHFVTRRPEVLERLRRTNRLLETRFRDDEHGGYYQQLARDFTVLDSSKTAASQLAPVSGHLLYLYAGTRDSAYLRQAERLTGLVTGRMRDPETGWVRERFTADWEPAPGSEPEAYNVGHNVEVAWLLARLALARPGAGYRKRALGLGERVAGAGHLAAPSAWIHTVHRPEARPGVPAPDSGRVLWWIQAYGNMSQLTLERLRRGGPAGGTDRRRAAAPGAGEGALHRYSRGVSFWRGHLLDARFGAAVTAVGSEGRILEGGKGGRWKTSYHSVEHALWNWMGEALWLPPPRPVTLHFRPAEAGAGEQRARICPRLVPDPALEIRSVRRGRRELEVPPGAPCFRAARGGAPLRVTLGRAGPPGSAAADDARGPSP